jgi:hypothetical protein
MEAKLAASRAPAVALLALGAAGTACGSAPPPEAAVWFEECARERGIDFVHVRADTMRYQFPEIMGGGVALLDADGDGHLDVYLVQSGDLAAPGPRGANRLFENLGGARFEDASAGSGAEDEGYGMGAACGDADQDGDTDLYVTNVGPNALLLNQGGFVFADATASSGTGDPGWGTSAAFFDPDRDGDLDLFVVNYVTWAPHLEIECSTALGRDYCSPNNYDSPAPDVLYENRGDGTFADVSRAAGITAVLGNGLGISVGDFDQDGWHDLYVANDQMPNQLWHNQGGMVFEDRALLAGCAVNGSGESEAGMGTVGTDADQDGDLDVFITHLREETNTLFVNDGDAFHDGTAASGLGAPSLRYTGFGTGLHDFDHDGLLDVYVANGAVTRNRPPFDPADPYAEPNLLFRGVAPGRFAEVAPQGGTRASLVGNSRGSAFGDLDEDGDVDVVVVENAGPARVLLNQRGADGHWIVLSVRERSGADALGALVRLEQGDTTRWRPVAPATSYCSSNDPRVHFGLGDTASDARAIVRWSDAVEEVFGPLTVDRVHELRRGNGAPVH